MKRIYTPAKKKTILIVDDDQIVVHIYREKFQRQGFNVEVSDDGENVMKILRERPVDLVMLDLCLPGINGVEVLTNIRAEFDLQALPVIVLSNSYLGNLGRAAAAAGANKCVTKTESTPARLLELVRELLNGNHSSNALEMLAPDLDPTSEAEFNAEGQSELAADLLATAPQILTRLRAGHQVLARTEEEASRQTELSEMHQQVHPLVGSTGLIGFRKIAQMANALEALFIELQAKPKKITPSVIRTLGQAIDTLAHLFEAAATSQLEMLEPPKILVVDDEVISRETICSALGKANLTAVSLDDPLAAQHLLEQERFDLIFLDVEMPGQSGLELCASIRLMPTNRVTPVVFVTAYSDFANRAKSALSGGNDFIAKPFLLVEMAVKALTWLFRVGAQPSEPATPRSSSPQIAAPYGMQLPVGHTVAPVPSPLKLIPLKLAE